MVKRSSPDGVSFSLFLLLLFSHLQDWTTELQRALSYDPVQAAREDNGEFWIEWRSIERFYDIMHINWDPAPYPYRNIVHYCWDQVRRRELGQGRGGL